jgi:hypothetical protein
VVFFFEGLKIMKMQVSSLIAMLSLASWSGSALAADKGKNSTLHAASDFGFVGEFDAEFGGDEVASVLFTNGSDQGVDAGQGVTLAIGMHYRPAGWDVDFSGTLGYKFVTTAASNADIGITRSVFQVLATYDPADSWWIAAGPVWHNGVKFDADGYGANIDFGSATGLTVQAGWKWIGLTYTNMEYTEIYRGREINYDASAIGLTLRWRS